jgi:hypothetical protein
VSGADDLGLIPRPLSVTRTDASFILDAATVLDADPDCAAAASWLRAELSPATRLTAARSRRGTGSRCAPTGY